MSKTRCSATKSFKKSAKKISSKIRDLENDICLHKLTIEAFHKIPEKARVSGIFRIKGLHKVRGINIYKVRNLRLRSVGGGSLSPVRIIYAHHTAQNEIVYLQIYEKAKQDLENKKAINSYLKKFSK